MNSKLLALKREIQKSLEEIPKNINSFRVKNGTVYTWEADNSGVSTINNVKWLQIYAIVLHCFFFRSIFIFLIYTIALIFQLTIKRYVLCLNKFGGFLIGVSKSSCSNMWQIWWWIKNYHNLDYIHYQNSPMLCLYTNNSYEYCSELNEIINFDFSWSNNFIKTCAPNNSIDIHSNLFSAV